MGWRAGADLPGHPLLAAGPSLAFGGAEARWNSTGPLDPNVQWLFTARVGELEPDTNYLYAAGCNFTASLGAPREEGSQEPRGGGSGPGQRFGVAPCSAARGLPLRFARVYDGPGAG